MTEKMVSFGDPDRFCIRIGWIEDSAPADERPIPHGWSMGNIEIIVGSLCLTAHGIADKRRSDLEWYLGPFFHWVADNWVPLLHEELFSWTRPPEGPASVSVERSLNYWSKNYDSEALKNYQAVQAWYLRHCAAAASAGGLFPDVFIRRFLDEVELSWTGQPPEFAPEGFQFEAAAGVARLNVAEVAVPLWEMLQWVSEFPPQIASARFKADWERLCEKIDRLARIPADNFAGDIAEELLARVKDSFRQAEREDLVRMERAIEAPYLPQKPLAVAMFGGISPNLRDADIVVLRDVLIQRFGQGDSELFSELSGADVYRSMGLKPHDDGYEFADYFLDDLMEKGLEPTLDGFVDIEWLCNQLSIEVRFHGFESVDIRGVALAGQGFGPTILVNTSYPFNESVAGQRFTIAHELCHMLADRNRAKGIGHTSGDWALPSIEKRANAFAAYLLMPRDLILNQMSRFSDLGKEQVREIAESLKVSVIALTHHLYNLGIIDEVKKDQILAVNMRAH